MIAHAAAHLAPTTLTEAGRVFVIPAPFLPWLAPVLILAGVVLQLAALARCRGQGAVLARGTALLCAAGALFVFAGAALDRDVTVGVGEALALGGIWFAWRKA